MQKKEQLKQLLVDKYLNRFLTFYISKTNSIDTAEELTQKAACECLEAIERVDNIINGNAYFWSIAHNTYKNYLNKKDNYILDDDYCRMQIVDLNDNNNKLETHLMHNNIRKSLSILSGLYRKVLVYYYYHELKIKDIALKLNISIDMVKFYLQIGKKKLKEIYNMNEMYGEKSFNPMEFSIYYSGIDFASVNVWDLFRRKLPGQIVLICHKKPKAISEISMETGCSSCYIEEEIDILMKAGMLKEPVKGKYQTNFHILRKEELKQIDELFRHMYNDYIKEVVKEFEDNFEQIKSTKIYNYDATIDEYKWIFADRVADIDRRNLFTNDSDYPKILSCGARGIVFGMEETSPKTACGQTPTYLDGYILWARDFSCLQGTSHNQVILKNKQTAQTVIDVYNEIVDDNKELVYAELIENNILTKQNGKLCSKVAYLNKEFEALMKDINNRLFLKLEKNSLKIEQYLEQVVSKNLPNSLKEYNHGFVMTWMMFFAGNKIIEALLDNGFLVVNGKPQISYFTKN